MSSTAPQPLLIESAAASLQKILLREAALALARRRILNAIPLAQTRKREVKATRAPFLSLLPTKANQETRAQLEDTRQTLADLQKELETVTSLESQILPLVAYRLETHLRRSSPDYVNGLAANRYPDDWMRIKTRLEDCILAYHQSLKTLADLCAPSLPALRSRPIRRRSGRPRKPPPGADASKTRSVSSTKLPTPSALNAVRAASPSGARPP